MREHTWRKKGLGQVRTKLGMCVEGRYASVDPGANGAVVLWSGPGTAHTVFGWTKVERTFLAAARFIAAFLAQQLGPTVVVMESQYVGCNPASGLTTARRASYLLGAVAALTSNNVDAVWVAPATWQSLYTGGKRMKSPEVKARVMEACMKRGGMRRHLSGLSEERQQGVADAWGIGYAFQAAVRSEHV